MPVKTVWGSPRNRCPSRWQKLGYICRASVDQEEGVVGGRRRRRLWSSTGDGRSGKSQRGARVRSRRVKSTVECGQAYLDQTVVISHRSGMHYPLSHLAARPHCLLGLLHEVLADTGNWDHHGFSFPLSSLLSKKKYWVNWWSALISKRRARVGNQPGPLKFEE